MITTHSDVKRFVPLHTLCRYLTDGNYQQIPPHFTFEYDTTGAHHSLHDYFELTRILNQLSSNGVSYRKIPGEGKIVKYEVNV